MVHLLSSSHFLSLSLSSPSPLTVFPPFPLMPPSPISFFFTLYRYVPFDFNQVCGHTHFDRLSILMDKIKADIAAHG